MPDARPKNREGVGTGAGRGGDPAQTEATLRVNGSVDCPEAPAQAHPLAACSICRDPLTDPADCPDRHGWEDHGTCCVGVCTVCVREVA